ncbi:MAG: T9SS type A sorting domain-containing protein, partial [Bacteroidota bacterium]|nr:T9SS type A sorting domain-containing protein [Bacteroidota bacterium]
KLDASGNFVWAIQMGGINWDFSYSIAVDASGNVYTTGYFEGTSDFDPGTGTYYLTPFYQDVFISKLGNEALSIELVSFKANCKNNTVQLSWSTAAETNNDYFTIERTTDAIHWHVMGTVKGAGYSSTIRNYQFTDQPITDYRLPNYYRLKQTDFDGKVEYFSIVPVHCNNENLLNINIFPNPAFHQMNVQVDAEWKGATYTIVDETGKTVLSGIVSEENFVLDISDLSVGIYLFRMDENALQTFRLVKN